MDMQQVLFQVAAESSKPVRSSPVAVHTPPRLNFLTCAIACRLLATNSKMQRSAAQACAAMLLLAVLCAAPAVEASSRQLANSRPRRRGPRVNIFTPTVDNFVQQRSYYRPLVGSTAAAGPVPLQQLQAPVVAAGYAQQQQLPVYQFVGSGAQRPAVVVGQPTLVAGGRSVAAGQATVVAAQPRVVAAAPAVAAGPPINAEFLSLRHNLGSRIHATTEKWFSRMGWRG
jgi:hypothetical protein